MARYTLKQVSKSYYQITTEGRKVGHVTRQLTEFVGRIGEYTVSASTAARAFDQVAAKALGFSTPRALDEHNAAIRVKNAETRQQVTRAVDQALNHSNFQPLFDVTVGSLPKKIS